MTSKPPQDPKTPGANPGSIDRAGLVGVGDLTTPRWTSRADFNLKTPVWQGSEQDVPEMDEEIEHLAQHEPQAPGNAQDPEDNELDRSSPWTIEAVDESDTNELSSYVSFEPGLREQSPYLETFQIVPSPPPISAQTATPESPTPRSAYAVTEFRSVKSRRSVEESAGEEILYPRNLTKSRQTDPVPAMPSDASGTPASPHSGSSGKYTSGKSVPMSPSGPSSSSAGSSHRHRRRPSDDVSSRGVRKATGSPSSPSDTNVRRHRSLGVAAPVVPPVSQQREKDRERGKERRRQDVTNSVITPKRSNSTSKDTSSHERHVRRASASAATSSSPPASQVIDARRTHDFSHLPPSPSSTALQHILKNTSVNHANTPSPLPGQGSVGTSSSVAHSLLRGTQEGWSGMDDTATAEALRKLDGISGRSLRARSSIISVASKSSSRPNTPGSKSGHQQWEGIESAPLTKRRSGVGLNLRDPVSAASSGQTTVAPTPASFGHAADRESEDMDMTTIKSSTTPMGTRSTGPSPVKRASGGSTHTHFTSTGTPTSVSRDSTSVSTSTSVTSTHASSRRHSLTLSGKLKRSNSTGSDTSSIHSEKDRAASLAAVGDAELANIPPVPPLPKAYQTPPGSANHAMTSHPNGHIVYEDAGRQVFVPPIEVQSPKGAPSSPSKSSHAAPISSSASATSTRTPSKKWSFSGLNLRLPSSNKDSSNNGPLSPLSPRKGSTSRNVSGSSPGAKQKPLPERYSSSVERDRDGSASPFDSSSSLPPTRHSPEPRLSSSSFKHGQMPFPASYPQAVPSPTRRSTDQSRPGSNNSHYTNTTSKRTAKDGPANGSPSRRPSTTRRLTPSSIPFFRRSSTHSINSGAANGSVVSGPGSSMASPRSPAAGLTPVSPLMPVLSNGLSNHSGVLATPPSLTRATPPTADITSSPGSSSQRKSVLMGLPSLLKGSNSRKSLHGGDKSDVERRQKEERSREREREKEREKEKAKEEKERKKEEKREEKERSESRISVLMGRRRGKVLFLCMPG